MRVISVLVCITYVLAQSLTNRKLVLANFIIYYALFFAYAMISSAWSIKIGRSYLVLREMILSLLWGIALITYVNNNFQNIHIMLSTFVWGCVIISIYCCIKGPISLSSWNQLGYKVFETAGQNQIYYSCILIFATNIAIYYTFGGSKHRIIYFCVLIFLMFCGLSTSVRKCVFIPVIFAYVYMFLSLRKTPIKLFEGTLVFIALGIIAYMFLPYISISMYTRINNFVYDIFNGTKAAATGTSFEERAWLRQEAIKLFKDHYLFGVGIGQYTEYSVLDGGPSLYSHNNFLEILSNTGSIGFILYYGGLFFSIIKTWKIIKYIEETKIRCLYNFIIAFFISLIIMHYGQVDYYQVYFIFFASLLTCCATGLLVKKNT